MKTPDRFTDREFLKGQRSARSRLLLTLHIEYEFYKFVHSFFA